MAKKKRLINSIPKINLEKELNKFKNLNLLNKTRDNILNLGSKIKKDINKLKINKKNNFLKKIITTKKVNTENTKLNKENKKPFSLNTKKIIDYKNKFFPLKKKERPVFINIKQETNLLKNEAIKKKIEAKKETKNVLKTQFDDIVDLVETKERIPLSEITSKFNIDKKIAQEWGEILSDNDLIDYHIPAFGEPEFRKKGIDIKEQFKSKKKINKKLFFYSFTVIFAILVIIIIFVTRYEKITPISLEKTEKIEEKEVELKNDVIEAFSGTGTYECRNKENTIKYLISDKLLKIEKLDSSSKVIIKQNKTYTLNTQTKKWVESEIKETIPLPGSGIYPKTELSCKQSQVNATEFNT